MLFFIKLTGRAGQSRQAPGHTRICLFFPTLLISLREKTPPKKVFSLSVQTLSCLCPQITTTLSVLKYTLLLLTITCTVVMLYKCIERDGSCWERLQSNWKPDSTVKCNRHNRREHQGEITKKVCLHRSALHTAHFKEQACAGVHFRSCQ